MQSFRAKMYKLHFTIDLRQSPEIIFNVSIVIICSIVKIQRVKFNF